MYVALFNKKVRVADLPDKTKYTRCVLRVKKSVQT